MPIDLTTLESAKRLLFKIPLEPLQGSRFQPTGFPSLGAATFQTNRGTTSLLVESTQSMANHLEMTVWDVDKNDVKEDFKELSHVRVNRNKQFWTDTILEPHRLNSPYLLAGKDNPFFNKLKEEFGVIETGPVDRNKLAKALLKYDVNSLLHGVFLEKLSGRLRVARALSAFIEADDVQIVSSGGVKNDYVDSSHGFGEAKDGFGNIPFARDEYTAESISLYVNLDLSQIRGYRLKSDVERLLILLALYKLRALVEGGIRLRTACDLCTVSKQNIKATQPEGWILPKLDDLKEDVKISISTCKNEMTVEEVEFNNKFKKGKAQNDAESGKIDQSGDDAEQDS